MAKIVGDTRQHRRRHVGRAADRLPDLRRNVFSDNAEGGDGARGRLRAAASSTRRRRSKPETGFNVFTFPSINGSRAGGRGRRRPRRHVQGHPASRGVRWSTWRPRRRPRSGPKQGGFSSANKNVDAERVPGRDPARDRSGARRDAETFRFDMSDLQPAAFGGTVGQGEFKLFQDFLKNPNDIDGIRRSSRPRPRRRTSRRK